MHINPLIFQGTMHHVTLTQASTPDKETGVHVIMKVTRERNAKQVTRGAGYRKPG